MERPTVRTLLIVALVGAAIALAVAGCTLADMASAPAAPVADAQESSTVAVTPTPLEPSTIPLEADEAAGLLYMREEEKLARDVYLTLAERWSLPVFSNIQRAEQQHMDAVLVLLEQYGLDDPAAGNPVGVFTDPDLQALYEELVAQGSRSLADALKVGAAIEEIDILDLEARIGETDNPDIRRVYTYLKSGSENHLRAFAATLARQIGETYTPQYLDQATYDAILAGADGG